MSVLDFIDSSMFTPAYNNDVPLIHSPRIDAICRELQFALKNREPIFVYGDYDMDGLCSVMVWKEVFSLLRVDPPKVFQYGNRTHQIDKDILRQVELSGARVVIICDTGSSAEDRHILRMLQTAGRTPIVIDHHVFCGEYAAECNSRLIFNSYEEYHALDNNAVSGAYACLLVAKVLCEKYMDCALAFNAKVYALASMYADVVDMSSPIARALYASVAIANAPGPVFFNQLNDWNYLYGRRFFSWIVAPKLNGCFRMERFDLLNKILQAEDRFHLADVTSQLPDIHSETRQLTKMLTGMFVRERVGEFVLCVHEVTDETRALHIRNFTGVVATKIAQDEKAPVVVVVKDNHHYAGSFRDYYNRGLLPMLSLFSEAGGHPSAFGLSFADLGEFKRHCLLLSRNLSVDYERPHIILNSGVVEGDADLDALALYNEFANVRQSVVLSHQCSQVRLKHSTAHSRYYQVGLPTEKNLMTKRPLIEGTTVLIEPAICRGVELREVE